MSEVDLEAAKVRVYIQGSDGLATFLERTSRTVVPPSRILNGAPLRGIRICLDQLEFLRERNIPRARPE